MDSFSTPKRHDGPELEVTGISRSGRVRKKSSKLMDFESPSNVPDNKKKVKLQHTPESPKKKNLILEVKKSPHTSHFVQKGQPVVPPLKIIKKISNVAKSPLKSSSVETSSDYETQSTNSDTEDDTISSKENSQLDEYNCKDEITNSGHSSKSRKKVRIMEEPKKKVIFSKDVMKIKIKNDESPKPKTRYTAYMLWSKEMRQKLLKENPGMDFTAMSKRLGELWQSVPNMEKYNWSNRAKRLTEKNQSPPQKRFVAKNKQQTSPDSRSKKTVEISKLVSLPKKVSPNSNRGGKDSNREPSKDIAIFRPIELEPIDVAAYLKLLGESLTVIGERLKEHNGQIAVSGSLSVLLDSLLCALGSLTCLTQQIPEIGNTNSKTLTKTLENIAYIMPGL